MDKTLYYNSLYDIYGNLLTDKQKSYYEDYYFNNLSLAEIAENYNVSRNAVHNQIKITIEKLDYYEDILKLYQKQLKISKILDKVDIRIKKEIEEIL